MRVALPVDPYRKTASEVATIDFIRSKSDIPAPEVIAFDASNDNELGFEWILMKFIAGQPLRTAWRKLSMQKKQALVMQLALFQSQLFDEKHHLIGNIFSDPDERSKNPYKLDGLVSLSYFWGDRSTLSISRGPFRNSFEWLSSRLQIVLQEKERLLNETDDEDEIEDAQASKCLATEMMEIPPKMFPPDDTESTFIFHDDLSTQNILVDQAGGLTGVVDWECVSALPLWRACRLPRFLDGRTRDERPQAEDYAPAEEKGDELDTDSLDNEGVNSLYWEHLLEYERGQLRAVFLAEMQRLQPTWTQVWDAEQLKRDFEMAMSIVDHSWGLPRLREWLDAYYKGQPISLDDD